MTSKIAPLKELLSDLRKKDLYRIADYYDFKIPSSLKKRESLEYLISGMKEYLLKLLEFLNEDELLALIYALDHSGRYDDKLPLSIKETLPLLGLVSFDYKDRAYIPLELSEELEMILYDKQGELLSKAKKNQAYFRFIGGLINIYGILSKHEIIYLFEYYYQKKDPNFINYLSKLLKFERPFYFRTVNFEEEIYLVYGPLFKMGDEEKIVAIIDHQEVIKRNYLALEKVLSYSDMTYSEIEEKYQKLNAYLKRSELSDEMITDVISTLKIGLRMGMAEFGLPLEFMSYYGENTDMGLIEAILKVTIDIFNNTRIFLNNGSTPQELSALKNTKNYDLLS